MSVAEIKKTKSELIAWIEKMSDINMIYFLNGLKTTDSNKDWWDALTVSQQNHINNGVKQAENNETIPSADFWQKLKNG